MKPIFATAAAAILLASQASAMIDPSVFVTPRDIAEGMTGLSSTHGEVSSVPAGQILNPRDLAEYRVGPNDSITVTTFATVPVEAIGGDN